MEHGNLKELRAIDLDSSDNLSEEMLQKFITVYGPQLHGKWVGGAIRGAPRRSKSIRMF